MFQSKYKLTEEKQLSQDHWTERQTLTKFNLTNYNKFPSKHQPQPLHTSKHKQPSSKHIKFIINKKSTSKAKPTINDHPFKSTKRQKSLSQFQHQHQQYNPEKTSYNIFDTVQIQTLEQRRKKRRSHSTINIGVTSQSEKQLLEFMSPKNLPEIHIVNRLKKSPVEKLTSVLKDEKKLQRFTQEYFYSIAKKKKKLQNQQIKYTFPPVKIKPWTVKGFVVGNNFIAKAIKKGTILHGGHQGQDVEKYRKFDFKSVREKIEKNYYDFLKGWLVLDGLIELE